MDRIIYCFSDPTHDIAVVEDGQLCEYLPQSMNACGLAESIFKGRVERMDADLNAAFVRIGLKKNGFLPLAENSRTVQWAPLSSGQDVLVQVKKEPKGQKGAYLSRDIALPGEYIILMPMNRYIGVSARVTEEEERNLLYACGEALTEGKCGVVMRAAARKAKEVALVEEFETLCCRWKKISSRALAAPSPSLLEAPKSTLDKLLDDYLPRGGAKIVASSASPREDAQIEIRPNLRLENIPGLAKQMEDALKRVVWLKGGGNLFIDSCEAMTVFDVNSAKFTPFRHGGDASLQLNLAACGEIARQTRLRNLSGVIVIDFVDMQNDVMREQVKAALETAFSSDRVKTVIHGFTSLGLLEMTRRRTRQPLAEVVTIPCPHCRGLGRLNRRNEDA